MSTQQALHPTTIDAHIAKELVSLVLLKEKTPKEQAHIERLQQEWSEKGSPYWLKALLDAFDESEGFLE